MRRWRIWKWVISGSRVIYSLMIKFADWLVARESSAFTRLRDAAAKGLMPPIPDASINSRSTATPAQQKALLGKGKKKRKRKSKKVKKK